MEIAITVALIAAAVALFAPLAHHRLAVLRERHARHAAACSAFRASILEVLRGLYPEPVEWPVNPSDIVHALDGRFAGLQAAGAAFRPYLPLWRRWMFDRAWVAYRLGRARRRGDRRPYAQYVPDPRAALSPGWPGAREPLAQVQAAFRRNVARLLEFAKAT